MFLFVPFTKSKWFFVFISSEGFLWGGVAEEGSKRSGRFTFHFITSLYSFLLLLLFYRKYYSSYFLKDSLRFWNKNTLLAASADFIKSCTLARNTDMKDSDEKPRKCFWGFFSPEFSLKRKMQKCPQNTDFSQVFNLLFPI